MPLAIQVRNLSKTFSSDKKKIIALDNISLDIVQGEVLGILGPNGAGKTTFLNILSTLLLPDHGTVEILGIKSNPQNFYHLRKILNMASGYPNFPWSLTVEENLRFYGKLYGLAPRALTQKVNELIGMFELSTFSQRKFEELSSGNKQRLALAKSMLNNPKIIFLDEPTVGLDPDIAARTREIIMNILKKANVTVLFTTHNMKEAETMCSRIAFIKEGRILKLATPQDLKLSQGKEDLEEVFIELAQRRETTRSESSSTLAIQSQPMGHVEGNLNENFQERIQNWCRRCLAFSYRNFLFAIRNLFSFMELLFWPIVSLISVGLMGDFLQLQDKALGFVMTGAITAGVLQVAQLDVAYSLLYEVWSKSMKHTLLTPIGVSENLFGSWLVGIVRGSAIFIVLGTAASLLFGFKFPSFWVTLLFMSGIFGSALLLGLLVSVLILIFGQKAEITAWMFAYVFMLLAGIYYPIQTLPPFFYWIAQLVPITYFLEYFRMSFGFPASFDYVLWKGFGLLLVYLFLGLVMMKFAFNQARKKGIIIKLSE